MADERNNLPQTKDIKPIVKGRVKEKGLGEKAAEVFLSEDTKTVKNYILWDVVIPSIKNVLADVVIGGIEMALFGTTRSGRSKSSSGGSYVSYTSYSDRSVPGRNRVDRSGNSANYDFSDIFLDNRGDAEEVITAMAALVEKYGEATVADLCSLVGVSSKFTDNKYGWTDCRSFAYQRSGRGFVLDFDRPRYLD